MISSTGNLLKPVEGDIVNTQSLSLDFFYNIAVGRIL